MMPEVRISGFKVKKGCRFSKNNVINNLMYMSIDFEEFIACVILPFFDAQGNFDGICDV